MLAAALQNNSQMKEVSFCIKTYANLAKIKRQETVEDDFNKLVLILQYNGEFEFASYPLVLYRVDYKEDTA